MQREDERREVPRRLHGIVETVEATLARASLPAENLCLVGPAGTGKTHYLIALGRAAVEAGYRVRYFTAAELVETLYRALADNSAGRVIETLLRNDLIICDEVPPPTNAAPWASPATGPSNPGARSCPNRRPSSACSTGSAS